jgi:hypothetical protein
MICKVMMHVQIGTPPPGSDSLDDLPIKDHIVQGKEG